jgi:hypothetical protein
VVVPPTNTLPEYCASLTAPESRTSIDGIPEMSLTEKSVPVRLFVIENNCPAEPSNERVPLEVGYALAVMLKGPPDVLAALNTTFGSSDDELILGVITKFLSEFAIYVPVFNYIYYIP